jgi:hypothetical protein
LGVLRRRSLLIRSSYSRLGARFSVAWFDNGWFYDGEPTLSLKDGTLRPWPEGEGPLDGGLLATLGSCTVALRGQAERFLDDEDSHLRADDSLTVALPTRRVDEWAALSQG